MADDTLLLSTAVELPDAPPEQSYGNIDPRLLKRLMRDPNFRYGYSSTALASMEDRITTGKWSPNTREIYSQVRKGAKSVEELMSLTGFSESEVGNALTFLSKKGYVKLKASTVTE